MGYGFKAGNAFFRIPNGKGEDYATGVFDAETSLVKFRNCTWFTNLEIPKRHEELILYRTYSPEEYPKYDNYDAINVDKTKDIPFDYKGVMGVPITFLDKYCPEQFEIIAQMANTHIDEFNYGYPFIAGERKYARILIRKL